MSEQPFREIQLSGKQLGFLFMASIALFVVIFLLGVSVGRGVRGAVTLPPPGTEAALSDTTVPTEVPPPTQTSPNDLAYHNALQGKPAEAPMPAPEPTAPNTPAAAKPEATPAALPAAAKPAAAEKEKPADKAAPLTNGGWVVQCGTFGSRENADGLAARLKAKGFAAFVDSQGPERSKFRVRVGPFPERADADGIATRLRREGVTPLITR